MGRFLFDMTDNFTIFDSDSHLLKRLYPMVMFYIAFFPPKSAISHTIFRNINLYTFYNYTYYATAIRPAN